MKRVANRVTDWLLDFDSVSVQMPPKALQQLIDVSIALHVQITLSVFFLLQ